MNLKKAMKAAIDGHILVDKNDNKLRFDGLYFYLNNFVVEVPNAVKEGWEIVQKPVKYSVDVWLNEKPASDLEYNDFKSFLVGDKTGWSALPYVRTKRYSITVEEVVE